MGARVALLALMMTVVALASADAEQPLSLRDAVALAQRQNPTILAAQREPLAAEAAAQGARVLPNPEIVITPGISGAAGSDEEFSLVQPLEVNGQRRARASVAKAELQASIAENDATRREIVRSVKEAYWSVAEAQAVVGLNRENVQLAESLYQAAERQVEVGTAPGSQAIKAQVEIARARQELARAESELAQAKATLNVLMGRAPETDIALADELTYVPLALNSSSFAALARANRPEIAGALARLAASKGQISVARTRGRPDLALQARQEKLGGEGGWALGVTLPLIDWGSLRAERRQAQAAAAAQEQRVAAVENEVNRDVYSALQEVERSEAVVREYQQGAMTQAEQLSGMARRGYQAGATGYLEVLEAQRTLRGVRTDYYSALADHLRALARLEWAVGVDLDELTTKEALP